MFVYVLQQHFSHPYYKTDKQNLQEPGSQCRQGATSLALRRGSDLTSYHISFSLFLTPFSEHNVKMAQATSVSVHTSECLYSLSVQTCFPNICSFYAWWHQNNCDASGDWKEVWFTWLWQRAPCQRSESGSVNCIPLASFCSPSLEPSHKFLFLVIKFTLLIPMGAHQPFWWHTSDKWKRNISMTENKAFFVHQQNKLNCYSPSNWKEQGWYVPNRGTAHCVCHCFWFIRGADIP